MRPLYGDLGGVALIRAAIDPAVAIGTLFVVTVACGERISGPYVILALLVFLLTFPGNQARTNTGMARIIGTIALEWSAIAGMLFLLGWASGTLTAFAPRVIVAWLILTPPLLFAAHRLVPHMLQKLLVAQGARKRAIVAVWNDAGRGLATRIKAMPALGIDVAGYFDDRADSRIAGADSGSRLGYLPEAVEYVKSHPIDIIYIALPMGSHPRILGLLNALRDTTVSIYFVPDIFQFDLIQARMETIGGMPVLAVCESPFRGSDAFVKRMADIVLSSAFLILFSPLMLAIAAGVKLSSPGPVLFRQRRYGLDGREIIVYKFRTMRVLEDGDTVRQAERGDPRVTRLGTLLRATSLDELPQFLNVLQGRMSVVGPRPHAVAHNETYRKLINGYMIRHKVKPGITGLAQVNGARGETDTIDKMRLRVEYDLAYMRSWSLQLDFFILLKTIVVVLGRQNAY